MSYSPYKMKGFSGFGNSSPAKKLSNSEKAKADGASDATVQKLKDQENKAKDFAKGKKKRDKETDPKKKKNLTTYIEENE